MDSVIQAKGGPRKYRSVHPFGLARQCIHFQSKIFNTLDFSEHLEISQSKCIKKNK